MKYIKQFGQFEALGVSSYLDPIVDDVIQHLSNGEGEHIVKTRLHGEDVKIRFVHEYSPEDYKGQVLHSYAQLVDPEEMEFLVRLGDLEESTVAHELKHVDRMAARRLSADFYYYLDHVGRDVIENLRGAFLSSDSMEYLNDVFYLVNPDEFEAHYNDIHKDMSRNLPQGTKESRMQALKDFLEDTDSYVVHRRIHNEGFSLADHFKSPEEMREWLSLFSLKLDQFVEDDPEYENWELRGEDVDMSGMERMINRLVEKAGRRGFRGFARLYTLI